MEDSSEGCGAALLLRWLWWDPTDWGCSASDTDPAEWGAEVGRGCFLRCAAADAFLPRSDCREEFLESTRLGASPPRRGPWERDA